MPIRTRILRFFAVTFIVCPLWASDAHAQRFDDVPVDYWAANFIETLAASGVTAGCGNNNFCPEDSVTRAQMAVFLERGMNGSGFSPPAATGTVFGDVGASSFAAAWIERLFADGITSGCGNNNYCPNAKVTRAQMAVFLERAVRGAGYSPPAATGVFGDVGVGDFAAAWIELLAADGITTGCGNNNYCPNAAVTRAQMAVFLVRAFNLGAPSDTTAPSAVPKNPGDAQSDVALNVLVAAGFDEDMASETINGATFKVSDADGDIPATVIFVDGIFYSKLSTNKTLGLLTPYTVTLTDSITDLAGNPLPETSWSFTTADGAWLKAPEAINRQNSEARSPVISANQNGDAFAVWEQVNDSGVYDIWASRYTIAGGWGPAILLESMDGDANYPEVGIDDAGTGFAIWEQADDLGYYSVWANRYDPASGWGTATEIDTEVIEEAFAPSISVDRAGNAYAVWQQYDVDTGWARIWARRYEPGAGWGTAEILESPADTDSQYPKVAADYAGNAIVVWEREDDAFVPSIWASRFSSGSWSAPEIIDGDPDNDAYAPIIAINGNGDAIVAWEQSDESFVSRIWVNRYVPGAGWDSAQLVQSEIGDSIFPSDVAIDGNGNATVVWSQFETNVSNVWATRYDKTGDVWSDPQVLNAPGGQARDPVIALDKLGNAVALWSLPTGFFGADLYSARYLAGFGWLSPQIMDSSDETLGGMDLAADGFGNVLAVWGKTENNVNSVLFNRFGGGGEPGGQLITDILFSDADLGNCVRAAAATFLWHFSQEVTALDCSNMGIESLGGLATFSNLLSLNLSGNNIRDISPLARFTTLEEVDLSNNIELQSVAALTDLDQLTQVNLAGSGSGGLACSAINSIVGAVTPPSACRGSIEDLVFADAALQSCVLSEAARQRVTFADAMKVLNCRRIGGPGSIPDISQLDGIENLENLEAVDLYGHFIQDITPLASLTKLRSLDLTSSRISTLDALIGAPSLESFTARSAPLLQNIGALSTMPMLTAVSIGEKIFEDGTLCEGIGACTTGAGLLSCSELDTLAAGLGVYEAPRACNMPVNDVVFADANLEACVLGQAAGMNTMDVTAIDCSNSSVVQLEGLERFDAVTNLALVNNQIQNLAPINDVYSLEFLYLNNNDFTDFYDLNRAKRLLLLHATDMPGLKDIRTLTALPRLVNVNLSNSGDTDISCSDLDILQARMGAGLTRPFTDVLLCDSFAGASPNENDTDFNGDGADDLVFEYRQDENAVLTANWSTALSDTTRFDVTSNLPGYPIGTYSRARGIALADANNDGYDDLLLQLDSATDDSVFWTVQLADGAGGFGGTTGMIPAPLSPSVNSRDDVRAIAFTDINDDGYADVLLQLQVDEQQAYFYALGDGANFGTPNNLVAIFDLRDSALVKERAKIIALEDLNNDGTADLVFDREWINEQTGLIRHCVQVLAFRKNLNRFDDLPGWGQSCHRTYDQPSTRVLSFDVADIDGDDYLELIVTHDSGNRLDWRAVSLFDDGSLSAAFNNLKPIAFANLEADSKRIVAVTDLNGDSLVDILVEITTGDQRDWFALIANGNATYPLYNRVDWWPHEGRTDYQLIGLRDYDNDLEDRPDLLFSIPGTGSSAFGLYVATNNGAGFNAPLSWHLNTQSAKVIGLEEHGLTTLANDRTELIAWVGNAKLYTRREFSDFLASKQLDLVEGDELDADDDLARGKCKIMYGDAEGDESRDRTTFNFEGKAEFGFLACNVDLGNDRASLMVQAIYGGCDGSAGVSKTDGKSGFGGKCEAGLGKAELGVDLSPAPSPRVEFKAPNASVCGKLTNQNACARAGANLVEASGSVKALGGVTGGAGVSVGVGAGAEFELKDGAISGTIDIALVVGLSVEFSFNPSDTGKYLYKMGETSFTAIETGGGFVIMTAGPRVIEAAEEVGGALLNAAGESNRIVETYASQLILFTSDPGIRTGFVLLKDTGAALSSLYATGVNFFLSVGDAAFGVIEDGAGALADGASYAWDYINPF